MNWFKQYFIHLKLESDCPVVIYYFKIDIFIRENVNLDAFDQINFITFSRERKQGFAIIKYLR